jgi:hypothetical protein
MEAHTEINTNTNTQCLVKSYVILSADSSEELQVHFRNEIRKRYQTKKRNLEDKVSEHILE